MHLQETRFKNKSLSSPYKYNQYLYNIVCTIHRRMVGRIVYKYIGDS